MGHGEEKKMARSKSFGLCRKRVPEFSTVLLAQAEYTVEQLAAESGMIAGRFRGKPRTRGAPLADMPKPMGAAKFRPIAHRRCGKGEQ